MQHSTLTCSLFLAASIALLAASSGCGDQPRSRGQQSRVTSSTPASSRARDYVSAIDRMESDAAKPDGQQEQRWDFIERLIEQGVFSEVSVPGTLPRIRVGPAWGGLDFKTRESFVSVVYAYYIKQSRRMNMPPAGPPGGGLLRGRIGARCSCRARETGLWGRRGYIPSTTCLLMSSEVYSHKGRRIRPG